jgi:hypothetical protein
MDDTIETEVNQLDAGAIQLFLEAQNRFCPFVFTQLRTGTRFALFLELL